MALLSTVRSILNAGLEPFNLRLGSRTAERVETLRLAEMVRAGRFERPVFPLLEQYSRSDPGPVIATLGRHREELHRIDGPPRPERFSFANDYFTSPDAEVLYAMVRLHRPRQIIEVGSGHSTLLFRQAITDGQLPTRLLSIDPDPRREIAQSADEVIRERVETLDAGAVFSRLRRNDILFIDSSHEIKLGNDVLYLFLNVLPSLHDGVIVHLHDIFLPFEYPKNWMVEHRWTWTEQYLLQALLQGSSDFEVLWAGHYLQRTLATFADVFPHWRGANASSVWLRRTRSR
jgi:predicted O-methyltransferase YrrM